MNYLSIVFQIPGLPQLHDWHLSLKPSRVLDQHCLQKESDWRCVCCHEVKAMALSATAFALIKRSRSCIKNESAPVWQHKCGHIAIILLISSFPTFTATRWLFYTNLFICNIVCLLKHACRFLDLNLWWVRFCCSVNMWIFFRNSVLAAQFCQF